MSENVPAAGPSGRRRARPHVVVLLLVGATLVVLAPLVAIPEAQGASRYALSAALADNHSVDVHRYHLGVDHAIYEGKWRSDKPPGQPILDVPFYAGGRVLGLQPATYVRRSGDLGFWWSALWSSLVPF